MRDSGERACKYEGEQAANGGQNAVMAEDAQNTEDGERRDDGQEFAKLKGDEPRNQDSRGNGSQGREEWISQRK